MAVYSKFSTVYTKLNDYRSASRYQGKYIHLKDSIFNVKLTTRLMAAEAEFKQHENAGIINAKNEIILLKEDFIRRQITLNVLTAIVCLLALAFSVYILVGFQRKRKLNALLEQKIRERTTELELSRDELLRNFREMNLRTKRASDFAKDSISRIECLCSIALQEGSDTRTHCYVHRIRTTVDTLRSGINTFLAESTVACLE